VVDGWLVTGMVRVVGIVYSPLPPSFRRYCTVLKGYLSGGSFFLGGYCIIPYPVIVFLCGG